MGQERRVLNVMTPLIIVISFSDSMQLTFAARDQLMAGRGKRTAFRNAILIAGPACVLTHVAAGLSLLGLLASSSDSIRGFGEAGFLATAMAHHALRGPGAEATQGHHARIGGPERRNETRLVADEKHAECGRQRKDGDERNPAAFSFVGFTAVASLGVFCSGLQPSYRLADQVPDKGKAVAASGR
jgi:hypothetical protein